MNISRLIGEKQEALAEKFSAKKETRRRKASRFPYCQLS